MTEINHRYAGLSIGFGTVPIWLGAPRREQMGKDASKRISRRKFLSAATRAVPLSMTLHHALAVSATSHEPVPAAGGAGPSSMTTVRVDSTPGHATNSFSPHRALGRSIDVVPYGPLGTL